MLSILKWFLSEHWLSDKRQKESSGAYHLHGKPGNSSWKMKWYASFHLAYF